jgi:predicted negative regulator of RcsB-dependent stress response/MFS family permease
MQISGNIRKLIPDLIVIAGFIIISFIYFAPAVIDGRVIAQHDSLAAIGQGQEQRDYMERHDGERTRWNISMFSGMPSYQMSPTYNSSKPLDSAKELYSLFLPNYVYLMFIMLIGFYILMRAFRASPLISALGAVIWTFSSYFFILISAGHIWKFITLAYIPPTIAGMVYVYRKRYLLGGLLFMIFVAFQISANHIQMSYYFLFLMLFMVIAFFVDAYKKRELPNFFKATGVLIIAGIIGVAANSSNLYHTYEYSKETMRGKSELSHHEEANTTDNGLERDYITAWSYGIGETWTLLVPNTKGGASVPLSQNEKAMSKARPEYYQIYQQIGQYWGDQPGTSGPVYAGAFVLALFILGLFIVKGPVKWALLTGTIFSILLSWGKNFMPLTDFFIDYIPMYNKFRAVSSILVVAEFCIPLLAALTVKEIVHKPEVLKNNLKYLYISLGLTGGLALLFAIAPKIFFPSYISANEMQAISQAVPPIHIQPLVANLTEMRLSLFTADALRSFIIVAIGGLILWLFLQKKIKATWTVAGILLLCLADMWDVNRRYLNDDDFVYKSSQEQLFTLTPTDQHILQDTTKYYKEALRVFETGLDSANFNNPVLESDFYGQIGDLNYFLKNKQVAFDSYEKALKLNPQNLPVLNNYSYYLSLEKRDLDKAEQMSGITVKLEPLNPTYLDTYGWILFEQGSYIMAKIYIEKAIEYSDEPSAEVYEHYGDVLFMNGEQEKAVVQWKKARELGGDSKTLKRKIRRGKL